MEGLANRPDLPRSAHRYGVIRLDRKLTAEEMAELRANAVLISAAPDMLDALVEAEACMSIVEPRSDTAEYLRVLGAVRNAIAKAKP